MSLVISVQTSLPWAHACVEDIASSWSDASSNAPMVTIVCSSNSRMASRRVAAMGASRQVRRYLARKQEQTDRDERGDPGQGDGQGSAMPQASEPASEIVGEHRRIATEALQVALVHLRVRERDPKSLAIHHDGLEALVATVLAGREIDHESAGQADHGNEH